MEMKQVRPRLTFAELGFIVRALRSQEAHLKTMESEICTLEFEVQDLRNKVIGCSATFHVTLKEKREELAKLKAQRFYEQALICRGLINRFERVLNGGKPHSSWIVRHYLEKLKA